MGNDLGRLGQDERAQGITFPEHIGIHAVVGLNVVIAALAVVADLLLVVDDVGIVEVQVLQVS